MARAGWLALGVTCIGLGLAPGGEWWVNLILVLLGAVDLGIYDSQVPK